MKIFLPIQLQATGGTSTFARKLQAGLQGHGHTVTFTPTPDYDLLLVSPRASFKYLRDAKRRGKPIVHRLDGVYYPATVAGWKFPLFNLPLNIIRDRYANYVIYQSNYSKWLCQKFLLTTNYNLPTSVIYNGVDRKQFSPDGPKATIRDSADQHVFITASRFRRADQILPLLKAFHVYREKYHQNNKFVIIGDGASVATGPAVMHTGIIPNPDLPSYLRAADVFLFSQQNPPCPNNIIEAMTCGLPICGVADGSMTELTEPGRNSELLPVKNQGLLAYRHLDPESFAANLDKIMQSRATYSQASRTLALARFSLDDMIQRYLEIFQALVTV